MCRMDYVILIRVVSNSAAAVLLMVLLNLCFQGVLIQFCKSFISREENVKHNSFFTEIEKGYHRYM